MAGEAHDRNTRLTNSYDVHVPSHNSEILKRSFGYKGIVLWNSLRHEVKLADNVNNFRRMYKDVILVPSQSCSLTIAYSVWLKFSSNITRNVFYGLYAFYFTMFHLLFYHDL